MKGEGALSYVFKILVETDAAEIQKLNLLFGDAFDDKETYCEQAPSEEYLRAFLKQEHVIALAAYSGATMVGGLVAYVLRKFERERSEVYIYDLAVSSLHRQKGIVTQLIEMLREKSKAFGAYVIFVQADYGDDPAVSLYSKLGAKEDVMHFDIPVNKESAAK